MKSNLNKIVLNYVLIFFLSSCHTLEHQKTFFNPIKEFEHDKTVKIENNNKKNKNQKTDKDEMAPIKAPKQKQKVKAITLNKKINTPKIKMINLSIIKNWSEQKLIMKMGQSDFLKQEGKLKNYQYHFANCFLDIFLTKKENGYFVTYIKTRSTKLYGKVETKKCLDEINSKLIKKF